MGHLVGKDIYRKLGTKIDSLTARAPWNDALYAILTELYTEDEAELVVKMPFGLTPFDVLLKNIGWEESKLRKMLDNLCGKGLVMDVVLRRKALYMISPLVVGIFEYTMMRTKGELNSKKWAELFHAYLSEDDGFYKANFGKGQKVSIARTLPWRESLLPEEYVEILDYEKAEEIIEQSKIFSVGICSCSHEKLHLGEKKCRADLERCTSFGASAEFLIRNNLAKAISKEQMLEILQKSKEQGLVLNADNVRKNVSFLCHCCSCCCNLLGGIRLHGYANTVVTSNYIAVSDDVRCDGCAKCKKACPIAAIGMDRLEQPIGKKRFKPVVDQTTCLGCGVCSLTCETGSMKLKRREKRVLYPENTFERLILMALERDNLQNMIFRDPQKLSHAFMRGMVGGFLRLPFVKQSLMSDQLRSGFLDFIRKKR